MGKQTRNTNKVGNNISMQNKLNMLFQPSQLIGRPNHSMMEYAWYPWSDSRSQIIFRRCDSVHGELFGIEPNNASQIRIIVFKFLE